MQRETAKTVTWGGRACETTMDCAKEALLVDSAIPGSWKRGGQIGSAGKAKEATPKDVFLSEIKTRDVFPLLILHMVRERPEYGNSLIRGVKDMTGGVMSVSPNTVYPLLRRLEEKGYVVGEWEKPETRSRRFYRITPRGENKYTEIRGRFEGHLLRVREAVETLHEELYGPKNEQAAS